MVQVAVAGDEVPLSEGSAEPVCCKVGRFTCSKPMWLVFMVVLINLTLFADQNLLAPALTPIAREMGFIQFNETSGEPLLEFDENLGELVIKVDGPTRDRKLGGDITLAFFLLGGAVSVSVGYLTDVVNRVYTLATVVTLGETACLATFWVPLGSYWGLFATRALTGVAIGGAVPLIFSLFGDLFTIEYRGKATAAAGIAQGAGGAIGQVMAGIVINAEGTNWRTPFVLVAVPAYALVILLLLTVKEPARGTKEEAWAGEDVAYEEKITWAKTKKLLSTPTVLLVFFQGIPASLPWGVIQSFLNDFLIEEKNVDRDFGGFVVLGFGFGAALGAVWGGFLADRWAHKKRRIPLVMGVSTAVGAFPLLALIQLPPQSVLFYVLTAVPSGLIVGITGSAVRVVLVNVTLPEVRGTAFAIFNLFDDIGKGLGAFVVALIIQAAGDGNRDQGLSIALLGWIIGAFFHFAMIFTINKDYDNSQAHLEALKSTVVVGGTAAGKVAGMEDRL